MSEAFETWFYQYGPCDEKEKATAREAWDAAVAEMRKPSPCGKSGHRMVDWELRFYRRGPHDPPGNGYVCTACQREQAEAEAAAKEMLDRCKKSAGDSVSQHQEGSGKDAYNRLCAYTKGVQEVLYNLCSIRIITHALDLALAKARREEASLWRKRIVECQLVGFVDQRLTALDAEIKELEAK